MIKIKPNNQEISFANNFKNKIMLYDLAPICLFTLSSEGKILEVKKKGAKLLNRKQEDLYDDFFQNFVSDKGKLGFKSLIKKAFQTKLTEFKESVILGNGNAFLFAQLVVEVQNDICNLAVLDITEYKKHELKLEETVRQLRNLTSEKDILISIIAHDLRNPFNSIIGFCELMANELEKLNYSKVERYSKIILESSNKAMELLGNLIIWSQSQSGKMSFCPERLNLATSVNDTIDSFVLFALQKDIIIKNKILQDLMIFADRNMLETILRNLVSNALKSTKFGGEITINALSIVESLTLNIKDDGEGMEKQELDNLFKLETPFTSLGTQNEKGTGLGLVICREFANRHGGKIWAETRKNEGSTFYVLFPHESH